MIFSSLLFGKIYNRQQREFTVRSRESKNYCSMGVSAPIARVSVHCLIWLIIFEVTDFIGGSSRTLKCNSIYLKKGPLISFW